MRWFKHMTSSNRDEKLMRLRDEFGIEGYGLYWIILEAIAEQCTAENDKVFLELSPKSWRKITEISPKKFQLFLTFSEKIGLFLVKKSENLIRVECPNLLKYRDEYSKKKKKKSGQSPDKVRCDSGPKSIDTETETETDTNTETKTETEKKKEKKKKKQKKEKKTATVTYPEWLDVPTWEAYLEHRKQLKSKMTDKAEQMALNKLRRLIDEGYDQKEVIEQTIVNGWKGLFPVNNGNSRVKNKSPTQDEYLFSEAARKTLIAGKQWLEETSHDG